MFFILNKPKIYSYLIVLSTVVILFFTAEVLSETNNLETLETATQTFDIQDNIINRFNTEKKEIAITINCVGSNDNIEEILHILEKYEVKANFGISGEWVKQYPEQTKKIYKRGNGIIVLLEEINSLDYRQTDRTVEEELNKINKLLNSNIKLIRSTYGEYNDNITKLAIDKGYKIIGLGIDTLDYQGLEENVIWDNIKNKIMKGDIISMNSNAENIADELEIVINSLKEREYGLVCLEDKIY